jgi:hypothetical protein
MNEVCVSETIGLTIEWDNWSHTCVISSISICVLLFWYQSCCSWEIDTTSIAWRSRQWSLHEGYHYSNCLISLVQIDTGENRCSPSDWKNNLCCCTYVLREGGCDLFSEDVLLPESRPLVGLCFHSMRGKLATFLCIPEIGRAWRNPWVKRRRSP